MNEINYLLKLGEQNISHASLVLRVVMLFSGGFILFIIIELRKMREERKLAKEDRKKLLDTYDQTAKLELRFISLVKQVGETKNQMEEMKNTMRDVSLKAKKIEITDNEIRDLIKDGLNEHPEPYLINSIMDFIWKKDIKSIKELKDGLDDKKIVDDIKNDYQRVQGTKIPGVSLMKYAYAMKKEDKKLKEVVPQEKIDLSPISALLKEWHRRQQLRIDK